MYLCRKPQLQITGGFLLLTGWFALENGWRPLAMVLSAAAVHEAGHLLALWALGAPAEGARLTMLGAVLEVRQERLSYGGELASVLAGPAANLAAAFFLLLAAERFPASCAWAGAHLVLAAFNLLPVRPLDGGRAVETVALWLLGPAWGERLARTASGAFGTAAGVILLYLTWSGGNLWLLPPAAGILWAALRECFR